MGAGILAVGVAFTTPAFFSALISRVAAHERGAAMGTMTVALDAAFGLGPMAFGLVAAAGGIPAAFVAGAVLAGVGAVGAGFASRRTVTTPA